MYAQDGDAVARDDVRAFEYFSRIANAHDETTARPRRRRRSWRMPSSRSADTTLNGIYDSKPFSF